MDRLDVMILGLILVLVQDDVVCLRFNGGSDHLKGPQSSHKLATSFAHAQLSAERALTYHLPVTVLADLSNRWSLQSSLYDCLPNLSPKTATDDILAHWKYTQYVHNVLSTKSGSAFDRRRSSWPLICLFLSCPFSMITRGHRTNSNDREHNSNAEEDTCMARAAG